MRGILNVQKKRVLVLCKTYPSPSGKYTETSCVAGVTEDYDFIRLFPIPYRFLEKESQFKKWQWIEVECHKADKDHRPESYSINKDNIVCDGEPLSSKKSWSERLKVISKLQKFTSFADIEKQQNEKNNSLALLTGIELQKLEIRPTRNSSWTSDEMDKLLQNQRQAGLFDTTDNQVINLLEKVPFDFYYYYVCKKDGTTYKHKIVDWEIGAAYRSWKKRYGENWEAYLRKRFEEEFAKKDLMFLMGTIHRFPKQWLIISLIYPPKIAVSQDEQSDLFRCI